MKTKHRQKERKKTKNRKEKITYAKYLINTMNTPAPHPSFPNFKMENAKGEHFVLLLEDISQFQRPHPHKKSIGSYGSKRFLVPNQLGYRHDKHMPLRKRRAGAEQVPTQTQMRR